MAEAFTSYKLENDVQFKAGLDRAIAAVSDLRIPYGLILADFYKSQQAIFKLQSAGNYPDFESGNPKIDGKTAYQRAKKKAVGFEYPLLFRTGKLAASTLGANNPGSVARIGALSITWGTTIPYGIYHQSDKPRKNNKLGRNLIPLRKFLFIGGESAAFDDNLGGRKTRWLNILNDYVLKKLKKGNV